MFCSCFFFLNVGNATALCHTGMCVIKGICGEAKVKTSTSPQLAPLPLQLLMKAWLETTLGKLFLEHLQFTVLALLLYNKTTNPISMAVSGPDQELVDSQILTNPAKTKHDGKNSPFCDASCFITASFFPYLTHSLPAQVNTFQ